MKSLLQFSFFAFLFFASAIATYGCTCVNDSLPKRFKKANAVFVAEAVEREPYSKLLIQNNENESKSTQIVKVIKSWKGVKKDFIAINLVYEQDAGMCQTLFYFEKDKQYLIFAYGNKLEVKTVCSDTWQIPQDKESFGYE